MENLDKIGSGMQRVEANKVGNNRDKGFTLIELMIVVSIVAIMATLVATSFNDFFVKNRVKSAAEEVYSLLTEAKSEVGIRNSTIYVNVDTTDWCVGYATTANCACDESATVTCEINMGNQGTLTPTRKLVDGDAFKDVAISGNDVSFSYPRYTASNNTIAVSSGDWQLNVVVSLRGRIRICNPNSNVITGYSSC